MNNKVITYLCQERTDYEIRERLSFEELTFEKVMDICDNHIPKHISYYQETLDEKGDRWDYFLFCFWF